MSLIQTYTHTIETMTAAANDQREQFIKHLVQHGDISAADGERLLGTTIVVIAQRGLLGAWWDRFFGYNGGGMKPDGLVYSIMRIKPAPTTTP